MRTVPRRSISVRILSAACAVRSPVGNAAMTSTSAKPPRKSHRMIRSLFCLVAIGAPALEAAEIASNGLCQHRGRCPAGANTVKPTFPIMEALLWRRAVAGPVRPRGTPMTSRHGHPVGARLRQFYAALIDERRLGARRSFFARVFSFSERLWSLLNEPALTFNAYHLGGP